MSRAHNSNGLILADSPTFKKVFGISNVSHSKELPFLVHNRKFNYRIWYKQHTDMFGQTIEPDPKYIAEVERWARQTYIVPPQMLQRKIYHQTGLYVTIGMGENPLLAKLAF